MRGDLPSGTVTFLFTDVEGSTKLLHDLGTERYAQALAQHRRALRAAFGAHGGVEVDTQGDAFFVAFSTAPGALAAAEQALEALATGPIRVRMGLHTGTPHLTEEGYVGADVHRAARIAAAGHGGQVLVSAATAALVERDGLRDLGEHRFKDLSAPERVYQLGAVDFAPLKSLHRTNLPVPATPFLGRERELHELDELLARADVRLLTLTGPGGTGKTRLALQAAAQAAERFPGGVFWVPLAPLRDPALVLEQAAAAVGAKDGLAEHIGDKSLLLYLDNFEHLMAAAGELPPLLAACPNLRLLVTSRELLRLADEQAYPVPPLRREEGEELFLARARAVDPGFQPTPAVLELCARLEQLPLALELAAARVRVLSPEQLRERLARRLDLLKAGRGVDPRQQTLRATIEWSHELLDDEEQRLFARVAAFAGGCTLEAVEDVCEADLDVLQSLVDKSLLRAREADRFWMLETIREYAAERLDATGDAESVRRRHAEWALASAERSNLSQEALAKEQRPDRIISEQDNMRAALDWALSADPELGLRIAVALEMYWVSNLFEGVRRLEALLARADDAPPVLRARAWRALGGCLNPIGEQERAERAYHRSLELFREIGSKEGAAIVLFRIGATAANMRDPERARPILEESLEQVRAVGNRMVEGQVLGCLGSVAHLEGDLAAARPLLAESASIAESGGFSWWQGNMLSELAEVSLELGDLVEAEQQARASLSLFRGGDYRQGVVFVLALLARLAAERGALERAGRLWGAIEAEEARSPIGAWETERDEYAAAVLVHAGPRFERARDEGQALLLDEAVVHALDES